jgi:hypothetical protein
MRVSVVEINGSHYRYGYDPDSQKTVYLGPLGDSPTLNEQEFLSFFSERPGEFKGSSKPMGVAMTKAQFKKRKALLDKMEKELVDSPMNFESLRDDEQWTMIWLYDDWLEREDKSRGLMKETDSLDLYRLQEMGLVEVYVTVDLLPFDEYNVLDPEELPESGWTVQLRERPTIKPSSFEVMLTSKAERMMESRRPIYQALERFGEELPRHHAGCSCPDCACGSCLHSHGSEHCRECKKKK